MERAGTVAAHAAAVPAAFGEGHGRPGLPGLGSSLTSC